MLILLVSLNYLFPQTKLILLLCTEHAEMHWHFLLITFHLFIILLYNNTLMCWFITEKKTPWNETKSFMLSLHNSGTMLLHIHLQNIYDWFDL